MALAQVGALPVQPGLDLAVALAEQEVAAPVIAVDEADMVDRRKVAFQPVGGHLHERNVLAPVLLPDAPCPVELP